MKEKRGLIRKLRRGASEIWQVGLLRFPWLDDQEEGLELVAALCIGVGTPRMGVSEPAAAEDKLSLAVGAVEHAVRDAKRFPGRIQVSDPDLVEPLRSSLPDVEVELCERLPEWDAIAAELTHRITKEEPVALLAMLPEAIAGFARAAVRFHASPIWSYLTPDDLLRIESSPADPAIEYASLPGTVPASYGLGLYPSREAWEGKDEPDDSEFPEISLNGEEEEPFWSVIFSPSRQLPAAIRTVWDRRGLPKTEEGFCPFVLGGREGWDEAPDEERLAFLEGLLTVLAETTEADLDAGRWEREAKTRRGRIRYTLSLPDLLAPPQEPQRELALDRRLAERSIRDLHRLLEDRNFESAEEINSYLAGLDLSSDALHHDPESIEERAQELIDTALRARGRRRSLLARQALEIWPDCAEAYVLLAEQQRNPEHALPLYRQGAAAGERALGPEFFQEEAGYFWGILETRPYMRALQGVAEALMGLERLEEAAWQMEEILRLNPNDNQGMRDFLATLYLELNRLDLLAALLDRYKDEESAWHLYSYALLAFRRTGDSPAARQRLRRARLANSFVPRFLLDPDLLPFQSPSFFRFGGEEEAVLYANYNLEVWESWPGALEWLRRRALPPSRPSKRKKKKQRRR